MNTPLKDLNPSALTKAIEHQFYDYWPQFGHLPQMEIHREPDMVRSVTGVSFPMFNGVTRAQLEPGTVDARIEETLDFYSSRNVSMYWCTGPSSQPEDLGEKLESHGFDYVDRFHGMAADLRILNQHGAPLPGLAIGRVVDVEMLNNWLLPARMSFGFPQFVADFFLQIYTGLGFGQGAPMHHYVGMLKGEPVSCSTLFLDGNVAGIYNLGTIPEARRSGIGSIMTLTPLLEARARGYRIGVLHSTEMGLNLYRQLGFEEYCQLHFYLYGI